MTPGTTWKGGMNGTLPLLELAAMKRQENSSPQKRRQPNLKLMNAWKEKEIFKKKRHLIYEKVLKSKGNRDICQKVQPIKAQRAHTGIFYFFNLMIRF